jgi:hypothetical protein
MGFLQQLAQVEASESTGASRFLRSWPCTTTRTSSSPLEVMRLPLSAEIFVKARSADQNAAASSMENSRYSSQPISGLPGRDDNQRENACGVV